MLHPEGSDGVQVFAQHINQSPNLLPEILETLFQIALFQECFNQWSLSRPMLSLMLVSQQHLTSIKTQLLASQPQDKHGFIEECLEKLMKDVDNSLESKNRDRFTQNLTSVRHDFKAKYWQ
jgi:exportin-7